MKVWWTKIKKFFADLMNDEPLPSFLFKQFIGFPLGIILATTWGLGAKIYSSISNQPVCKISSPEKNSLGYFYKWNIQIKDKNQGGFLLYPKDDALIRLSSIQRPLRVTEAHMLGQHKSGDFSRGIKFIYIEGSDALNFSFETYSDKQLNIPNTKDATCEDLLSNL